MIRVRLVDMLEELFTTTERLVAYGASVITSRVNLLAQTDSAFRLSLVFPQLGQIPVLSSTNGARHWF